MLFEQTQSIVSRVQQILREYPYGDAVLLELLQNADDAGADVCHVNLIAVAEGIKETSCEQGGANRRAHFIEQMSNGGRKDDTTGRAAAAEATLHRSADLDVCIDAQLGPVLEFFNNSTFTERDLNNIQNIGGSLTDSKKHDGTKVGRFGLGFNSAYHVSDVIAFVSVTALVVFDPSRTFLPPTSKGAARGGGYRWNYVDESNRLQALLDEEGGWRSFRDLDWFFLLMMSLFETDGCCGDGGVRDDAFASTAHPAVRFSRFQPFNGTLFRLPLRQAPSALWREVHTQDQLLRLIQRFPETATLGLVLTKNVVRISASVSSLSTGSATTATATTTPQHLMPLYTLRSTGTDPVVVATKAKYLRWLREYTDVTLQIAQASDGGSLSDAVLQTLRRTLPTPQGFGVEVDVELVETAFAGGCGDATTPAATVAADVAEPLTTVAAVLQHINQYTKGPRQPQLSTRCHSRRFSAAHQFGPGDGWAGSDVLNIAEECARYHHPISVPWSAAIVEDNRSLLSLNDIGNTDQGGGGLHGDMPPAGGSGGGKLICFFPIRSSTGLPLHIHGYFQLSSDRQSVASADKSRWNAALCAEVVPFAYACAILRHCTPSPRETPLRLWPLGTYTDHTISLIADKTIALLATQKVFPCRGEAAVDGEEGGTTYLATPPLRREQRSCASVWSVRYEALPKVVLLGVGPNSSSSASSSAPRQKPGTAAGGASSGAATEQNERLAIDEWSAAAYHFLLSFIPPNGSGGSGGGLIYIDSWQEAIACLPLLGEALRKQQRHRPTTFAVADAAFVREQLSRGMQQHHSKRRGASDDDDGGEVCVRNDVALVLLSSCLSDGKYRVFLKAEGLLPPLFPTQAGVARSLRHNLLVPLDDEWDALASRLPIKARILCRWNGGATTEHNIDSCAAPPARAVVSARQGLEMLRLVDADCIRTLGPTTFPAELANLLSPRPLQPRSQSHSSKHPTAQRQPEAAHDVAPSYVKDEMDVWQLELPAYPPVAGGNAGEGGFRTSGDTVAQLMRLLTSACDPQAYVHLSVLPALPLAAAEADGGGPVDANNPPTTRRRRCVSAEGVTCIAIAPHLQQATAAMRVGSGLVDLAAAAPASSNEGPSNQQAAPQQPRTTDVSRLGSEDDGPLRALFHVLLALGATAIDTSIVPLEVLTAWSMPTTAAMRRQQQVKVTILDGTRAARDSVAALQHLVLVARGKGEAKTDTVLSSAFHQPLSVDMVPAEVHVGSNGVHVCRADAIRRFFASAREHLTVGELQFVSTLPIFRTIWDTLVPLLDAPVGGPPAPSTTNAVLPPEAPLVFLVPPSLPEDVGAALRRGPYDAAATTALCASASQPLLPATRQRLADLLLIDITDSDTADLSLAFRLQELPLVCAMALAATRLPPPLPPPLDEGNDRLQTAPTAAVWETLFKKLHELHQRGEVLPELLRCSLQLLARVPMFPAMAKSPGPEDDRAAAVATSLLPTSSEGNVSNAVGTAVVAPCDIVAPSDLPPALVALLATLEREGITDDAVAAGVATVAPVASSSSSISSPTSAVTAQRLPRVGVVTAIPAVYREAVLTALGVATTVDGEQLLTLCRVVSHGIAQQQRKPHNSNNIAQQQQQQVALRWAERASCDERIVYAAALLSTIEAAKQLDERAWGVLEHLPLVPASVSVDAATPAVTAATTTSSVSSSNVASSFIMAPLGKVCLPHVHRLCPMGPRYAMHPLLLASCSAAMCRQQQHQQQQAQNQQQGRAQLPLPHLIARFAWAQPPSLRDVLHYMETMAAMHQHQPDAVDDAQQHEQQMDRDDTTTTTAASTSSPPMHLTEAVAEWYGMLDHVEQQLRVHLRQHHRPQSATPATAVHHRHGGDRPSTMIFPQLSSAATVGIPDFLDPMVQQADFVPQLRRSLSDLYFPEKSIAIPTARLAFDPHAERCLPFLATIEKSTEARFPALWHVLGIRTAHTPHELLNVLDDILTQQCSRQRRQQQKQKQQQQQRRLPPSSSNRHHDPTSATPAIKSVADDDSGGGDFVGVRLSNDLREAYCHVLEYFTDLCPTEARERCQNAKSLLVPTADGSVNWGHLVHYTVGGHDEGEMAAAPTDGGGGPPPSGLLHPSVKNHIAKVLGMRHTGIQLIAQLHNKHARSNFRAKGQRQSVVNAIKRILGDYSDQQSILMEMLQNADDACATEVTFYLDHRKHDTSNVEGLLGAEMARCQGPSLVVVNDSHFTTSDFDALLEIGCGHKAKDQLSIGRFGVGFNSVYHLTDCPSIVSGDVTLFLDPGAAHLESASPDAPGVMITHTQEPGLQRHFPAQFAPYKHYGVDFLKPFPMTLFRLPLRTDPWEKSLSPTAWTALDMKRVFRNFETLMPHVLLFLKHLETIRFVEVHANGEESMLSEVQISDAAPIVPPSTLTAADKKNERGKQEPRKRRCDDVTNYREDLLAYATVQHPQKPVGQPLHATCLAEVAVCTPATSPDGGASTVYTWLLSTTMHSIASGPTLSCDAELRRKLLPWGSVAVLLAPTALPQKQHHAASAVAQSSSDTHRPGDALGHRKFVRTPQSMVHCFLPLPSQKGELPFHVHGCFALTSDRRGMWTQSLTNDDSWEVTWNKYILSEMIGDAAVRAFLLHPALVAGTPQHAPDDVGKAMTDYYRVFPLASNIASGAAGPYDASTTMGGGGGADHGGAGGRPTPTDVLSYVAQGFFRGIYRQSAHVLWSTQRCFVDPQRACCGSTPQLLQTAPFSSAASSANAAGGGLAHCLPEGLAERVLSDEQLCFVPPEVFHALCYAASTSSDYAPPAELTPHKIAKELYARAGSSTSYCVAFASLLRAARPGSMQPDAPPFEVMAQLTLYVTQVNDAALVQGVPLVYLRDGTVGIVGGAADPSNNHAGGGGGGLGSAGSDGGAATPAGAAAAGTTGGSMFIAPEFRKEVEKMFPMVPVVDERYYDAVMTLSRKKHHQPSKLQSMHYANAEGKSLEPFTPQRWSALLSVEPLQVTTIARLFHLHAAAQTQSELMAGRCLYLDRNFKHSALHRWCLAFWQFVRKVDTVVLLDPKSLDACGDLRDWPLIPAKRAGEQVLLPMKECELLVCGSMQTSLVYEALEHLGVWALDTDFDEWQTIRIKCSVVDIEGQKIGDLLESAVKQGRFDTMSDEHREKMLDWLLQCNKNHRGFIRSVFGGSGPLVNSIRKLPLFLKYDGAARCWRYSPIVPGPSATSTAANNGPPCAVPEGVPLSPLCNGMFKRPVPELELTCMPMAKFLGTLALNAMLRIESTPPTAEDALTISEELALWVLVYRHMDNTIKSLFQNASFIPLQRSRQDVALVRRALREGVDVASSTASASAIATTHANGNAPSLRRIVVEWIADADAMDAASKALEERHPNLYALIRNARFDHLDRRRRFAPSAVVRPVACYGAPFPQVISMLMQFKSEGFSKIICPSVLWEDGVIQPLLVKLGVSYTLDAGVLQEAAEAFRDLCAGGARCKPFCDIVASCSKHHTAASMGSPAASGSRAAAATAGPAEQQKIFRFLSWSLGLCMLRLGTGATAVDSVKKIRFVAAHPLTELPHAIPRPQEGGGSRDALWLHAPADMCAYQYRHCVWLHRPVLPQCLEDLQKAKPPILDVLSQLQSLLSDGGTGVPAIPDATLNVALSKIYSVLSTEYRGELTGEHAGTLVHNAVYAVPVPDQVPTEQRDWDPEWTAPAAGGAAGEQQTRDHVVNRVHCFVRPTEPREEDDDEVAAPIGHQPKGNFDNSDDDNGADAASRHPLGHPLGRPNVLRAKLSQIISLGYSGGSHHRIGSLQPHFYHLREFEWCPSEASLLHVVSLKHRPFGPPSTEDVVAALEAHAAAYAQSTTAVLAPSRLQVYVELLKLLVLSADHHGVVMYAAAPRDRSKEGTTPPLAAPPKVVKRGHTAARERDGGHVATRAHHAPSSIAVDAIRIPDTTGRLTFLSQGIAIADQPSMLRRILPDSVLLAHPSIPFATCRALGVPSIGRVLREEPRGVHGSARKNRRTRHTAGADDDDYIRHQLQRVAANYRSFFASPLFLRVVHRLLVTSAAVSSSSVTGPSAPPPPPARGTPPGAIGGQEQPCTQEDLLTLQRLNVDFVEGIQLEIAHVQEPEKNIANRLESPPVAFSSSTSTIYVVVPSTTSKQGQYGQRGTHRRREGIAATAPHHYLIAIAINKILRNQMAFLAPLCCVLEAVAGGATTDQQQAVVVAGGCGSGGVRSSIPKMLHGLLDVFDCSDVATTTTTDTSTTIDTNAAERTRRQADGGRGRHPQQAAPSTSSLAAYERQRGRLLNVPTTRDASVRSGSIVEDHWLLKYAVNAVPLDDDANEVGGWCVSAAIKQRAAPNPFPLVAVRDAATGMFVWGSMPVAAVDQGAASSRRSVSSTPADRTASWSDVCTMKFA